VCAHRRAERRGAEHRGPERRRTEQRRGRPPRAARRRAEHRNERHVTELGTDRAPLPRRQSASGGGDLFFRRGALGRLALRFGLVVGVVGDVDDRRSAVRGQRARAFEVASVNEMRAAHSSSRVCVGTGPFRAQARHLLTGLGLGQLLIFVRLEESAEG
jgi:hypothetical protein